MTERQVTFYFAYNSPYSFLANTRIEAALAPYNVAIARKPVYTPRPAGQAPDFSSPRMFYVREDVGRFAEAYGLTLDPGPFADSGKACRGFLFAEQAGAGWARGLCGGAKDREFSPKMDGEDARNLLKGWRIFVEGQRKIASELRGLGLLRR